MYVRYAKSSEKDNIREIWDYCFNDGPKFTDYYFEEKYDEKNTIVVEDDNNIVSSVQLNQYKIQLNGKEYDTSYIVGVSTLPEARGRGYMKSIMDFTLNELYKKNQFVSILMPVDYRLYRKYGYEHCYDQIEYQLEIEDLKPFKTNGKMKKANENHADKMKNIKEECLKNVNGNIVRNKSYYKNLFKEVKSEDGFIYMHESKKYDGYLIYFINGENMFVKEIYYTNMNSLKSMLKFVYNHNTQCKKVTISAPINDPIRLILANPRTANIKIKPFMMGRIINFEKYLESLYIDSEKEIEINIMIEDSFIKENNHIFKVKLKDHKLTVTKGACVPQVELDINAISQLAFSYISVRDVFTLNSIDVDEDVINDLELIFNKKDNYINEYI